LSSKRIDTYRDMALLDGYLSDDFSNRGVADFAPLNPAVALR